MGQCGALASNAKGGEIPYSLKVSLSAKCARDDCNNCEETVSGTVIELDTSPSTREVPSNEAYSQSRH